MEPLAFVKPRKNETQTYRDERADAQTDAQHYAGEWIATRRLLVQGFWYFVTDDGNVDVPSNDAAMMVTPGVKIGVVILTWCGHKA